MILSSRIPGVLLCATLAVAASISSCAASVPAKVEGVAVISDGTPVAGGTIIVRRVHGFLWGRVSALGSTDTDADGRFDFLVPAGPGTVDFELERRRCHWSVGVAQVEASKLSAAVTRIEIVAFPDQCTDLEQPHSPQQ